MQFEIDLAGGVDGWALRAAELEIDGWEELHLARCQGELGKEDLPATLRARYLPDGAVEVSVTVLAFGDNDNIDRWYDKAGKLSFKRKFKADEPTRVRIDVSGKQAAGVGGAIRKKLEEYSYTNDGEVHWWAVHAEICAKIDALLGRIDKLSNEKLECGERPMSLESVEALIALAGELEPVWRENIHHMFTRWNIAKKDWAYAVKWLVKEFEYAYRLNDQLSTTIYELTVPAIGDDLVRFIRDKKYGDERWPLCLAVTKTKHPESADAIVTCLGEGGNTRGALEALAKIPAQSKKYLKKIRPYLRHSNPDVRRQAKKTLAKLGVAFEPPPPPVHVVKKMPKACPKGLEEWSANLDLQELEPTLKKLAKGIEKGFADTEIAEVIGVAEALPVDKTKAFLFPVRVAGKAIDLWIEVFMDDVDAPDVTILADAAVLRRL